MPSGGAAAPRPATTAVYGKEAGVGVAVSLNNVDFGGTGAPRAKGEGADAYDPLADCFVVSGLPRGRPLVFASAAFDVDGSVIGGVGEMTSELISALPLPRTLIWSYLTNQASRLGCDGVAKRAVNEVQRALIIEAPDKALWEQSPTERLRLVQSSVAYLAAAELRAAAQALLLAPILSVVEEGGGEMAHALDSLLDAQSLILGERTPSYCP